MQADHGAAGAAGAAAAQAPPQKRKRHRGMVRAQRVKVLSCLGSFPAALSSLSLSLTRVRPLLTPPLCAQRKHPQKARTALLQKPYHLLTWQEKLTLEDIGRRHAAKLQQQKLEGPKCAANQAKPPTPYNTTEVSEQ